MTTMELLMALRDGPMAVPELARITHDIPAGVRCTLRRAERLGWVKPHDTIRMGRRIAERYMLTAEGLEQLTPAAPREAYDPGMALPRHQRGVVASALADRTARPVESVFTAWAGR